jgi:CheY-like chemotaxis protein
MAWERRRNFASGVWLLRGEGNCPGRFRMPTILVVDNEPEILTVFGMALEWQGYGTLISSDGVTGLQFAARSVPDLIVTDWNMPGMDGVELCRRLKSFPGLAPIPVIMVSGSRPEIPDQPLWDFFLYKPVDLEILETAVALLVLSRPSREMLGPICIDRAVSRWQPVPSACTV